MVPAKLLEALQTREKQQELLGKLRLQTSKHFLERAACDINDALTSILAVSDTQAPQVVPKVKRYIERVNDSLLSLKVYQSALQQKSVFNINAVLSNILNVIEENLNSKVEITRVLNEVKAMAKGDQSDLEELLLYLFVQLAESGKEGTSNFNVELRQKDENALIIITNNSIVSPEMALRELKAKAGSFKGAIQINPQATRTEFIIRLELLFFHPHPSFASGLKLKGAPKLV